jgi:hypothetical protein
MKEHNIICDLSTIESLSHVVYAISVIRMRKGRDSSIDIKIQDYDAMFWRIQHKKMTFLVFLTKG